MAEKIFMPDASPEERRRVLEDTCDHVENDGSYIKALSEEDVYAKREILADKNIQLRDLKTEKKEQDATMKGRMKPVEEAIDLLITELKTGQEERYGKLYLLANHSDGMMEYYDEDGTLIKTRRLKPEERQGKLLNFPQGRTGN